MSASGDDAQDRPGIGYQGTSSGGDEAGSIPHAMATLHGLMDPITPWALRVAVTLGIPDLIAHGTTTLPELAERSGADPDALGRMLRHLVHKKVFDTDPSAGYSLTPVSELLCRDHPAGMAGWLDLEGASTRWDRTFVEMLSVVRTGQPAYEKVFGRSFWEDLAQSERLSASFDALMAQQARWSAPAVAGAYDFGSASHVVDVGGGSGTLLAEVLRRNPHLKGTLVERSGTASAAPSIFTDAGVADRAEIVAGSFFDELPAGADVYLVANVMHDWPDADAAAILRRCAEAAGTGGRVVIVEGIVADSGDQEFVAELDMLMLAVFGGRERSRSEFEELTAAAGLSLTAVHRTDSGLALMDCTPGR